MKLLKNLLLPLALSPVFAAAVPPAGGLPQGFSLDGVLTDNLGTPISTTTTMKFLIHDGGSCLMYEEQQTILPGSDGSFSVVVGSEVGSSKRTGNDSGYVWARIFQNSTSLGVSSSCPGGFTPSAGLDRKLRVFVNGNPLPDISLKSVPSASVAETLQGRVASEFLILRDDGAYDLNQANAENVFSSTNYPRLVDLLAGNYIPGTPTAAVNLNGQVLNNIGAPVALTDATNKDYTDTRLAGKALDLADVASGFGTGKVLTWDGANNKWVAMIPTATDSTKLPLTGGTMTGSINMGNTAITNVGLLTIAPGTSLRLGQYDNTAEGAAVGTMTPGSIWYNTTVNQIKYRDNSGAQTIGGGGITALTGDVVATGAGSVAATISNGAINTLKLFANPGINRIVATDGGTGATLVPLSCSIGQILTWTVNGWACANYNANGIGGTGNSLAADIVIGTNDTYNLIFRTNNTEKMRIDTGGNVGIGTVSPGRPLHVNGAMRLSPLALPGSPVAGDLAVDSSDSNKLKFHNGVSWMTINTGAGGDFFASGSAAMTGQLLGIVGSVSTPSFTFSGDSDTGIYHPAANEVGITVGGTYTYRFNSTFMSSGNVNGYLITNGAGSAGGPSYSWGNAAASGMYSPAANVIGFSTGGIERLLIDSSGNVGLGVSAPATLFDVGYNQNSPTIVRVSNLTNSPNAKAGYTARNNLSKTINVSMLSPSYGVNGAFLPNTGVIDSDGPGGISIAASDTGGTSGLRFYTNGFAAGNERMRIDYAGNVGVGTSAPTEKMHILGNLRVQGTTDCTLGNGAGGTNCTSDIRLKNNVAPIQNALAKVLSLRGVEFDWNQNSLSRGRHDIGVIAQEVEKHFPTAVITDASSGFKKVDYAVMVAPLIESIKELNEKLNKAEQNNALLKAYLCKQDRTAEFCL